MTPCVIAFGNETNVKSFSSDPILVGGGVILEIANSSKHLPGVGLAYRNYLSNKQFSFSANIDYFAKIHDYDNQLDFSTKINTKLLHQGEIILHAAAGPTVRLNFDDNNGKGVFSILGSILMSIDYKLNNTYILETAIENKFGFSRRPDTVISFKVYRSL
jgi:hypothetical protein